VLQRRVRYSTELTHNTILLYYGTEKVLHFLLNSSTVNVNFLHGREGCFKRVNHLVVNSYRITVNINHLKFFASGFQYSVNGRMVRIVYLGEHCKDCVKYKT